MKKLIVFTAFLAVMLVIVGHVNAQYAAQRNSVGLNAGGLSYSGRFSVDAPIGTFTSVYGSFTYRQRLIDKLYVRAEVMGGQLKGNNKEVESQYQSVRQGEFQTGIGEVSVKAEYDFIDLKTYKVSPFINIGAGGYMLFGYSSSEGEKESSDLAGFVMPVGVGIKYRLNNRIKLLAESGIRFFSNNLDGYTGPNVNNPNKYYNVGIGFIYELERVNALW